MGGRARAPSIREPKDLGSARRAARRKPACHNAGRPREFHYRHQATSLARKCVQPVGYAQPSARRARVEPSKRQNHRGDEHISNGGPSGGRRPHCRERRKRRARQVVPNFFFSYNRAPPEATRGLMRHKPRGAQELEINLRAAKARKKVRSLKADPKRATNKSTSPGYTSIRL